MFRQRRLRGATKPGHPWVLRLRDWSSAGLGVKPAIKVLPEPDLTPRSEAHRGGRAFLGDFAAERADREADVLGGELLAETAGPIWERPFDHWGFSSSDGIRNPKI